MHMQYITRIEYHTYYRYYWMTKAEDQHMNEESRGLKDESRRSYSEYRMMKAKDQTENDEEWKQKIILGMNKDE